MEAGSTRKLFGDGLRERGADILPDLNLARVGGDRAIGGEVQPRSDVAGLRAAVAPLASGRWLGDSVVAHQEDQDPSPHDFEHIAPPQGIQRAVIGWACSQLIALRLQQPFRPPVVSHVPPPGVVLACWAACCMAATMRG